MQPLVSSQPTTTATLTLRPYQEFLITESRAAMRAGHRRVLLVLPTGGGKTIVAARIILGAVERGKRILFLAHRRELIEQPSRKLDALGVDHGIVMASHWRQRRWLPVQVASVATLVNRDAAPPDLIFIDEAHRARAASYQAILDRYPQAFVIGLTATPIRSDGKGLGNLFQRMIHGPSVAELTEEGYLVPTRVFAPSQPDVSGVKKTAGDYNAGGLQRVMDRPVITGDIVSHWRRLASDRLTVCFAAGIEHSQHIVEQFRAANVAAAHLDGTTPTDERDRLLGDLEAGRIQVLSNYGVLTEGWDSPAVACCILARPTASMGLYRQMAGRVLRPADGKHDCIILDHAGCTLMHGMVDEPVEWSLDVDRPVRSKPKIDLKLPKVCPECFAVCGLMARVCECGYEFAVSERGRPDFEDGELEEITSRRRDYSGIAQDRRKELYLRWAREGAEKGWKASAAWAKYYAMFKESPKSEWMLEASVKLRPILAARDRAVSA